MHPPFVAGTAATGVAAVAGAAAAGAATTADLEGKPLAARGIYTSDCRGSLTASGFLAAGTAAGAAAGAAGAAATASAAAARDLSSV